jgi:hypothetical protein
MSTRTPSKEKINCRECGYDIDVLLLKDREEE